MSDSSKVGSASSGALIPSTSSLLIPFPATSGARLVKFEMAKRAVAMARRFEDVVRIKDGFAKLQALARIRDDRRLEIDVAELYQDCVIRIGQLSRELEQAKPAFRGNQSVPSARAEVTKAKALRKAGIGTSLAAEAEELAGGKTQQGQQAATEAAKVAFAKARGDKKPITRKALRKAVRESLEKTLGPPPKRTKRERPVETPAQTWFIKFTAAVGTINELPADILYSDMAEHSKRLGGLDDDLADVKRAIERLERWQSALLTRLKPHARGR
jgi:hypothetical protein